tara:strand:+ start:306 stop:668 length:363 start_codon:yes stop_codon:yes gene_type:complete
VKRDNENFRSHRVSSLIKKEIALVKQELGDSRLKDIFIIDVEVSRDLKHAKIYFGVFDSHNKKSEDIEDSKRLIDLSKNFFKKKISSRLKLKRIPNLLFIYDDSEDKASELENIIKKSLH